MYLKPPKFIPFVLNRSTEAKGFELTIHNLLENRRDRSSSGEYSDCLTKYMKLLASFWVIIWLFEKNAGNAQFSSRSLIIINFTNHTRGSKTRHKTTMNVSPKMQCRVSMGIKSRLTEIFIIFFMFFIFGSCEYELLYS